MGLKNILFYPLVEPSILTQAISLLSFLSLSHDNGYDTTLENIIFHVFATTLLYHYCNYHKSLTLRTTATFFAPYGDPPPGWALLPVLSYPSLCIGIPGPITLLGYQPLYGRTPFLTDTTSSSSWFYHIHLKLLIEYCTLPPQVFSQTTSIPWHDHVTSLPLLNPTLEVSSATNNTSLFENNANCPNILNEIDTQPSYKIPTTRLHTFIQIGNHFQNLHKNKSHLTLLI